MVNKSCTTSSKSQSGVVLISVFLIAVRGMVAFLFLSNSFSSRDTLFSLINHTSIFAADSVKLVEDKTLHLLKLNKEHAKASNDKKGEVLGQLIKTARERKEKMVRLAQEDSTSFLKLALNNKLRGQFLTQVQDDIEEEVALSGTLEVLHSDNFDKQDSRIYFFLLTKDNKRLSVNFADKGPEPRSGIKVKIKGVKIEDQVVVASSSGENFQVISETTDVLGTSTTKKVAVILFNFQNDQTQPYTPAEAKSAIFTGPSSSNAYHTETSFNKLSLEGKLQIDGDVFGWYTIGYDNTSCAYTAWSNAARAAATSAGVDLTGYTNYIYAFTPAASCAWGGLSELPGIQSWINVELIYLNKITSHELGHNFGVHHASSYECTDNGQRVPISQTCTTKEYGDPFDVMGFSWGNHQMNNFHKGQLTWLDVVNTQTVSASGTYVIDPIERSSAGVQALRIPRDKNALGEVLNYYYIEYRQPFGFDNFNPLDPVVNGVSIRLAPAYSTIARSFLIDTAANTIPFEDSALGVGQTFMDTIKAISIKTLSRTADNATVEVGISQAPPCIRANPTVTIAPLGQWGQAGEALTYAISVTNNDSLTCNSSQFSISPTLPGNWLQFPQGLSLTVYPGSTGNVNAAITSAQNTVEGYYSFTETVTNTGSPNYSQSVVANYNVYTPDTAAPTVSVTNPVNNSKVSGSVNITADATDSVGVAKVEFYVDNTLLGTSLSSPYSVTWDTTPYPSNSSHTIFAKAYDAVGNIGISSTIVVTRADISSPTTSITTPANNSSVSGQVQISANALDDVAVTKVEFLVDNNLIGTKTSSPYSVTWDSSIYPHNSTHSLVTKAYDEALNVGTSASVSVKVIDVTAPSATITSPADKATVKKGSTVIIAANAADVSGIQKVEFRVNGVLKCTDTTAAYSCNWAVPNKPNAVYTLEAKSYDIANNTAANSIKVTAK